MSPKARPVLEFWYDGNEIVPQKLAKLFPGSIKTPSSYGVNL
jgi:hypothetical protein